MIRVIAATLCAVLGVADAQQVVVEPSTIPGIDLVAPHSPAFEKLVTQIVGPERPLALAVSLPYGVIVQNKASEAIAAIDTVWTAGDRILLDAADQLFYKPILYLKPGQSALVVPPGILQNQRQLQFFADGTLQGHRLENFKNLADVSVAVDAVVFESGQFAGQNRFQAFERWRAQIDAPLDLAVSVLRRRDTQSIGDIVSWMEELAAVRRSPAQPYDQERIFAARVLLAVYRSKGEAELYARAKSTADAAVFPLHR